jgi:hypothetical protein
MSDFSDLNSTVVGGFTQKSGVYNLTIDFDPKESNVSPRHLEHTDQPLGRVFPFSSGEETADKSGASGEQKVPPKAAAQNPVATQQPKFMPLERQGARYNETVLSKKVLDALAEDIDPAKSLADIRRVLIGPTRRLHEARMEEVITILEESDRANQQALGTLEKRHNDLARSTERLQVTSEETQRRIQDQASTLAYELQKNLDSQQQMLSEMFLVFDAQLEKLTGELNERIDSLAVKTGHDHQALASDLTRRIQELTATTRADNDRVASVMEARLARSEAHAEKENRRHIEVFADGFSDIADRLLALRGVQAP